MAAVRSGEAGGQATLRFFMDGKEAACVKLEVV